MHPEIFVYMKNHFLHGDRKSSADSILWLTADSKDHNQYVQSDKIFTAGLDKHWDTEESIPACVA